MFQSKDAQTRVVAQIVGFSSVSLNHLCSCFSGLCNKGKLAGGDVMSIIKANHRKVYRNSRIPHSRSRTYSCCYFMTMILLVLMSVFIIAHPAFPDSDEDDCGHITTWSESDTNLGGSYTAPVRFGFKNNPDKYIDYFAGADHDHTGFLAAYSIPGWVDIDLEVRIASFESNAVALSEFDDWAYEHCNERNNYFGITKREGTSCYVESWQRDPKTGEIIGCSTLWITEVYRGCVITIIDSGLAGEYISDANGCDNVKTIHYDVLNKVKDLIDRKCGGTHVLQGKVTDAWGRELACLRVKFKYDGKEYQTTTDDEGNYQIGFEGVLGKKADLSLVMECWDEDKLYFTLWWERGKAFFLHYQFEIRGEADLIRNCVVENDELSGTEYFGWMFYHFTLAAVFYVDLGVDLRPVNVRSFLKGRGAQYIPSKDMIEISDRFTLYKDYCSLFRPNNLEWHEYSHHAMNCLYGKLPGPPPDAEIEETNHAGYSNPSTADSFVEGFAIFMPFVFSDKLGYKHPSLDWLCGDLECNWTAWEALGRGEDKAVAGILWDLYDGVHSWDGDTVQFTIEEIWDVLKDFHPNMHSVYTAFVSKYPDQKAGIDLIFIKHGFFADKDPGNGKRDPNEPYRSPTGGNYKGGDYFIDYAENIRRDPGETIGQATNYQRPNRHFPPPLPGRFVKVNNDIPLYKVTVAFPQQPELDYEVVSANEDGLIHLVLPPEGYQANIAIVGYDEDEELITGNPLYFTTEEFMAEYAKTVEQGYYIEHEFNISGNYKKRPQTDPWLLSRANAKLLPWLPLLLHKD